ncbi:MAG: hypothetical protein HY922_15910 [Elusimicrobia bacterium]|nr:hypothetical protein [Elusimicrobiota bacterium]
MNSWIRKSIELASAPQYLDKLHDIYPPTVRPRKKLTEEEKRGIAEVFESKDNRQLIKILLKFEAFPFKDPYVGFLRFDETSLDKNPKTVARIADKLRGMGLKKVLKGMEREKEANTAIGPLFKQWLPKLGYALLSDEEFLQNKRGIVFLKGSDQTLKEFCNRKLESNLKKRPDFVANCRGQFAIGEAKFITNTGGNQNNSFEDALDLAKGIQGKAIRVAILDGIVWLPASGDKMFERLKVCTGDMLSALLLKKYLENM